MMCICCMSPKITKRPHDPTINLQTQQKRCDVACLVHMYNEMCSTELTELYELAKQCLVNHMVYGVSKYGGNTTLRTNT